MNPGRILAIHVSRIGDTLLTGPSLRALAENYAHATIDFFGHPKRAEVMKNLPFLCSVGRISKKSAPFRGWFDDRAGGRYDLAVVWGQDEALVRYALRTARRVVACRQHNETLNARLTAAVTLPSDRDIPLADWQLSLVEQGLGITTSHRYVEYQVSDAERAWAQRYLAAHEFGARRVVGLIVQSFPKGAHRDWPVGHFGMLCTWLAARYPDLRFLVLGAKLSLEKTKPLREALGKRLLIAAGALSLRQSAALMNELDLYVGLDTGPSHIAAALGVPTVVLFHCMRRGPLVLSPRWPERVTMIEHPTAGDACSFSTSMESIAPDLVFAAACRRLEGGRA